MAEEYSEEDEADILHIDDLSRFQVFERRETDGRQEWDRPEGIMESHTDAEKWRLEVERVAPSLKVTVTVTNKDWRSHLDQMHSHR